ncbi:BAG domain-containing protein Samui isoform X2 [Anoplophora glabripennis]|uniref:BAG domain-containing protein Samui isoform X2 n=1 Tax=Anoplophora glabripennis TaxID=217634 RepID=UPI000874663B|nr:BAG domain-containing protein Samui isoform X2 [Anoplophora glabripennis]
MPFSRQAFSGFPFERDTDRDGHFRSQLDDIAKRHPEFAEHLGNFSRRRQSSGGDTDDFHRRFERPFTGAGNFERFGFPFDRDNFDPEQYAQQFYKEQPEYQQPQQQSYQHPNYQHQYSYQPQSQEYQQPQQCPPQQTTAEEPCASESGRNNIQQSNTTDLGQKQEPVNDRNQRSMSAPPTEKGQRFTSSINIPVNQPQPEESENMAQTQTDGKTTERIIPIHIEGRDEPVMPKTAPPTFSQPHPTYNAGPQPERIFGQRPEHFTQYVNREPRQFDKWHRPGFEQHQGFGPDEFRQQRYPQQNVPPYYQQQQQQRPAPQQHVPSQPQPKEEIPIPVQRDGPQTKQQAPPQQTPPPQQPAQPKPAPQQQKPRTPIDQIQVIQKDVSELMGQVQQFAGQPKDKQYLYLDEMLTRNLLKLDDIDTQGQETIRSARKEAIKCIEKAISVLEAKAAGNVEAPKTEEKMEVEEKLQEPADGANKQTEVQTMETELPSESKPEENQPQPMEFSPESTNQEPTSNEEKKDEEKSAEENPQPVTENRAVLVTSENKEAPKAEAEQMETKEKPPSEAAEGPKPEATAEGQESNLPVAEAVKKFESKETESKEEKKPEENKEGAQVQQEGEKVENKSEEVKEENKGEKKAEENKEETKAEEKKEKKKGKKKAEKKEK